MAGSAVFSLNDLCIKQLSGAYALHQVILVRGLVGVAFILTFAALSGQRQVWRTKRPMMHLIRACIVMVSNATYFLGLAALPLANAVAIGFVAPLLLTMLSVLVLISALCYAITQTMTRMFRDTESAVTINFYTQMAFIILSASMGMWTGDGHLAGSADASLAFLFRPWGMPPASDWIYFVGTGLSVAIGGLLMAQAYRMNETALVAPFEYTSMPLAVIWGLIFFGTFPDLQGWVGIALIIGAGLYTLYREAQRRHRV